MLSSLSMFIMAFNEERTIADVIRECDEQGGKISKRHEIIVVLYEGSTDRTLQIVKNSKNI